MDYYDLKLEYASENAINPLSARGPDYIDTPWQACQSGGNNYYYEHVEVNMANVKKISVSMTPQHAEILREAVKSGAYASGSEVIREAMRDWSAKWAQKRDDISKLRELWAEGKASGLATEVDFDTALDEARAELTALQKHDR